MYSSGAFIYINYFLKILSLYTFLILSETCVHCNTVLLLYLATEIHQALCTYLIH